MNLFCMNQKSERIIENRISLSEKSTDILQKLKGIESSYFFRPQALAKKLKNLDPIELSEILNCYFLEMIQENNCTDPIQFLDRLATAIPFSSLQEAVKDDIDDVLEEAKGMLEEAKLYLEITSGEGLAPSYRSRFLFILDGCISVIESIITAFGIGDFFKPAESEIHADFKSQKIMILLSLFSMITTMILPLLGAAAGGLIIGGTLLAIAALSVIWPAIKPKTTHLPANAENWTKRAQSGVFIAQGRRESLDEIAAILKMNHHAILVGPSRVGKSLTAKAFARAIERGDYPELKSKTVFRINTTDILDQAGSYLDTGKNILNCISTTMGRHRHDIILVLDEIHMACKNEEKVADQLKTFLDEGGEFPHVIGITTEEEYDKYVKDNNAFSLRFDRVDIESTDRDETIQALAENLLSNRSKPLIDEEVLDYIYDKSCQEIDAPQPITALTLLKRCVNRTGKTQRSPTEKKMLEVSNKILSLRAQAAASRGKRKEMRAQIAELKEELEELQEICCEEQKELHKLFKSKDLLDRVTKETYSLVLKISTIAHKKLHAKDKKKLKMFVLLYGFLGRLLESHIKETSEAMGIKIVIDKNLIDEEGISAGQDEHSEDESEDLIENE